MPWKMACRTEDVPESGLKECALEGGGRVLIVRAGEEYFAYQASCPHQEVPLEEGFYDGDVLTCHQHLWQFDVRSGEPLGIAEEPLQGYPLKREEDVLYVLWES